MPPFVWPIEPSGIIAAFEVRYAAPEAGALLMWAVSAVDALYYLADVDASYDAIGSVTGMHHPDVIDIAHARWAVGTAMTALDLCAAALGRAICKHSGHSELDLGSFVSTRHSKRQKALLSMLPSAAAQWLNGVIADRRFEELKAVRDALTHRRLPRILFFSSGPPSSATRLELQIREKRVRVVDLVIEVRDLATTHVADLIRLLPKF